MPHGCLCSDQVKRNAKGIFLLYFSFGAACGAVMFAGATDTSISDSFGRQCGPVFRLSFFDVYDWPPQANLVNNLQKWSVKLHVSIDLCILSDPVKLINCQNVAIMDSQITTVYTTLHFQVKQLNFKNAMIKWMVKLHVSIDLCILSDSAKLINCKNQG